jgi:class 3 adenylate cyclase
VRSLRAQDYVALGRSVNLSARLMAKSRGGVYLDQETFEHLPLEVLGILGTLPPMHCKGFS